MFHSATLKLTAWYLLILMSISLIFSVTIYNAVTSEVGNRLSDLQHRLEQPSTSQYIQPNPRLFSAYREDQWNVANRNILWTLFYVNLLIFFGGGALSYMLARRTLNQIEESHEAQSRFTSDVSHELRTPLAAMKAELEVALRDKKLSKDEMRELLASNLEEVNKLTTLSRTLLQLSKLDHTNIEQETIDLGITTSNVVQKYDKNAQRIVLELPAKPVKLKGNTSSIEELITIFVDNALKYSPTKSKIKIKVGRSGRNATFDITNEGEGIPAEDLPHIFNRFYRVDTSRSETGTGLGLSLAKKIVELHEGELSVSSAPGKETTFRFALPLYKKDPN